jgi:hypothetical protein
MERTYASRSRILLHLRAFHGHPAARHVYLALAVLAGALASRALPPPWGELFGKVVRALIAAALA